MQTRDPGESILLIEILPEFGYVPHSARVLDKSKLHCFERVEDYDPSKQTANKDEPDLAPHDKRRKLKNGKAKSLGDILEGLS
jgi:hypothetical protein